MQRGVVAEGDARLHVEVEEADAVAGPARPRLDGGDGETADGGARTVLRPGDGGVVQLIARGGEDQDHVELDGPLGDAATQLFGQDVGAERAHLLLRQPRHARARLEHPAPGAQLAVLALEAEGIHAPIGRGGPGGGRHGGGAGAWAVFRGCFRRFGSPYRKVTQPRAAMPAQFPSPRACLSLPPSSGGTRC